MFLLSHVLNIILKNTNIKRKKHLILFPFLREEKILNVFLNEILIFTEILSGELFIGPLTTRRYFMIWLQIYLKFHLNVDFF